MDLPLDIWLIIIEIAYPINRGWHRGLCRISLVNKMHRGIVDYLLMRYVKKPIISKKFNSDIVPISKIIKFMARDMPIIEAGFLLADNSHKNLYLNFQFTNIITDQPFLETNFCREHCLLAKTFIHKSRTPYTTYDTTCHMPRLLHYFYTQNITAVLGNPVIIIPVGQDVLLLPVGDNGTHYLRHYRHLHDKIIKNVNVNDTTMLKIIKYILEKDKQIPADLPELINLSIK